MTGAETAQIITAIATLVSVIGGILVSLRNSSKLDKVHDEVKTVAIEANGMKDALVKATGKEAFARGVKSETDKQP